MDETNAEGRLVAARRWLIEIWADPQIRAIARKHANSPQVAEDALQATFLAMIRLPHLDQIENMPGYFCRALIRAVYHEQAQLSALLVDDFPRVTEEADGAAGAQRDPSASLEDTVCAAVQAQFWHKRLTRDRDELMDKVPGRSDNPGRYRKVIYDAAEQILRHAVSGELGESDSNDAFRSSYPEYFDAPGARANTSSGLLLRGGGVAWRTMPLGQAVPPKPGTGPN